MDKRKVDLIYRHGEVEEVEEFGSIKELLEMEERDKRVKKETSLIKKIGLVKDFKNLVNNNKDVLLELAEKHSSEIKEKQNTSGIEGSVIIRLQDYQNLVEGKRIAQATLQIFVDTIHEIQPLIEKHICSKNHRETIYILEQLDEAMEYYYG